MSQNSFVVKGGLTVGSRVVFDSNGNTTLTKTDIGLSNVDNKSSATILNEITPSLITTKLGFDPVSQSYVDNKVISYNSLTDKPTLFDGNYNSLTDKPTLFDGNYDSLTNKPTLFDGNYDSLTNKPSIPSIVGLATQSYVDNKVISYNSLTDKPTLFSGSYTDLTNKPTLFDGTYASLTGKPTLFDGTYASLTGKPTLATVATSGSYTDLTNKPSIPSIAGLATETYVNTAVTTAVNNSISPFLLMGA